MVSERRTKDLFASFTDENADFNPDLVRVALMDSYKKGCKDTAKGTCAVIGIACVLKFAYKLWTKKRNKKNEKEQEYFIYIDKDGKEIKVPKEQVIF